MRIIVEKRLFNDYSFSCALINEIDLDVPVFFLGGWGWVWGDMWQ